MKESKKEFKYALRACRKSQPKCKADAMAEALRNRSPKKFWQSIRRRKKSWLPSAVGGETGNKAVTVMWRKHFSALQNSSKNCGIGNFVHQNKLSHGNFEGIDELMCNSFKIKSLLYKLPRNRAAGKDGIFAEHIFYADSSVCNHMSTGYFTIVETKRQLLKPLSITLFIFLFPDCHREIVNLSIY